MNADVKINRIAADVVNELREATRNYPKLASAHEGWAVLKEEVDELWDEVKKRPGVANKSLMRKEAVQAAAMAMRFLLEVCDAP